MEKQQIVSAVQEALQNVLGRDDLEVSLQTSAKDVEGWDSLANVRLFIEVESKVGLRFSPLDLEGLNNIGDIVEMICGKLS